MNLYEIYIDRLLQLQQGRVILIRLSTKLVAKANRATIVFTGLLYRCKHALSLHVLLVQFISVQLLKIPLAYISCVCLGSLGIMTTNGINPTMKPMQLEPLLQSQAYSKVTISMLICPFFICYVGIVYSTVAVRNGDCYSRCIYLGSLGTMTTNMIKQTMKARQVEPLLQSQAFSNDTMADYRDYIN